MHPCFPYHIIKYDICKVDEQHYLWIKQLKFFFFWWWGVWVGVLVKIYRFLSASLICKLMECNIAYNGGPLFFVQLQYNIPTVPLALFLGFAVS